MLQNKNSNGTEQTEVLSCCQATFYTDMRQYYLNHCLSNSTNFISEQGNLISTRIVDPVGPSLEQAY